jgi:glycosyltransferase involved in cell wall biosynthesis
VRRADRVIAISHAAKEDIVARLGVDPATVDVTPLGVSAPTAAATAESVLRERLGLRSRRVLLCVSATNPHKNIGRLLEAFAQLNGGGEGGGEGPGGGADTALVIAGAFSPNRTELEQLAHRLAIETRVRFLDWLSEEDLDGLYGLADGVVYPSLMEGFGLPVLEAMQRGVPVACSNVSAVGEVAGDAAELFDPFNVGAIVHALDKLLNDVDHRAELIRRGKRRCELYSWSRTARATIESYERAIAKKR